MAVCPFLRCRGQISGLLLLAGLALASVARADGLVSHSVVYDVKAAPSEKEAYVEAQASFTLTRRCDGWALGEIFQFGIDKGPAAPAQKKLSDKAERVEEKVTAQESLDGRTLSYQTRLRQNARVTTASGKATLGAEPGKLTADLGRYKQDSDLPAGTLAPAAARAALLEALLANKPGLLEIRTVHLRRFHHPIVQKLPH